MSGVADASPAAAPPSDAGPRVALGLLLVFLGHLATCALAWAWYFRDYELWTPEHYVNLPFFPVAVLMNPGIVQLTWLPFAALVTHRNKPVLHGLLVASGLVLAVNLLGWGGLFVYLLGAP